MEKLKGKKILVTGATGGIGSAAVRLLAAGGADVFISGRNTTVLYQLAKEVSVPESRVVEADLTQKSSVMNLQQVVLADGRPSDILVNAAGIGIIKPFEQLTEADFRLSIDVNLFGAFNLVQAFLPAMKTIGKGLIIQIPGVLGKSPMAGAAAYAASKYAVNGMMKSLREELKRTEIRITQLFLGGVDSPFWDTIDLRVQRDKMIYAEEAGRAIWFLCQQPASGVVSEMVLQPFNHQVI